MNSKHITHIIIGFTIFFTSCAKLPFNKKVTVLCSKVSKYYIEADSMLLNDGNNKVKSRWLVFSDRENNSTQVSINNDMVEKKLAFLQPLFVLKSKGNFVRVTSFDPSINLKETSGRLVKKALKFSGWISKDKLLLWSAALKESSTSFTAKAIVNVADVAIIIKPEKYLLNDSLLLFASPDLLKPISKKITVGKIVFIYKISDDKKSYLIGNEPSVTTEGIDQSMLGWISVHAVTIWGARSVITLNTIPPDTTVGLFSTINHAINKDTLPSLNITEFNDRSSFENIFPFHVSPNSNDSIFKLGYQQNILDYSKNKIFNVLGKPIYYNKYREIIKNAKKLNVVFVIDGGQTNRLYLPSVKSVLQDLQLYFDTTTAFQSTHFGAILYKNTKCTADTIASKQKLTDNYIDLIKFIDEKEKNNNCTDEGIYQPVNKGIIDACNLLNPVKNETNLIVVVGTTGSDEDNLSETISAISKVQARLLYFQTINKSNDAYNDFVLNAGKIVVASAQNIAEFKKEKLVNQNDVITNNSYNLKTGDSGIYHLDFPLKSMTQGYILFPKKGDVLLPGLLKNNFDSLLQQIIQDNQNVTHSLNQYFKSNIGVNNTDLKKQYSRYDDKVPSPISVGFASSFININNGFFIPGFLKQTSPKDYVQPINFGVLLTETEYDKQAFYFDKVFKLSGAAKEKFHKRKAIRKYTSFLKKYTDEFGKKLSRGKIKSLHPNEALAVFTGFVSKDSLNNDVSLKSLKSKNNSTSKQILMFFNSFKKAANTMRENKNNQQVRVDCKGNYYYWVDKKLMPFIFKLNNITDDVPVNGIDEHGFRFFNTNYK